MQTIKITSIERSNKSKHSALPAWLLAGFCLVGSTAGLIIWLARLAIEIPFIAGVYPDGRDMVPEIFQGIGLFLVALATTTAAAQETAVRLGATS